MTAATAIPVAVFPHSYRVGDEVIPRKSVSTANDSWGKQVSTLLGTSQGQTYFLKLGNLIPQALGLIPGAATPALDNMAKIFGGAYAAAAVPRAITSLQGLPKVHADISNPIPDPEDRSVTQPISSEQLWQRRIAAISKDGEAGAMVMNSAALFAGCSKETASAVSALKNWALSFSLMQEGTALYGAASDALKARRIENELGSQEIIPNVSAPDRALAIETFRDTKVNRFLSVLKATASVALVILGAALALGLIQASFALTVAFVVLGLAATIFGIAAALHKQRMRQQVDLNQIYHLTTQPAPVAVPFASTISVTAATI